MLSPVPLGSLDVASEPAGGAAVRGTVLMRLYTEPGATIYYAFHAIDATTPAAEMTEFSAPTEVLPPVNVWAVADKAGQRGLVRKFAWTLSSDAHAPEPAITLRRLFGAGGEVVALPAPGPVEATPTGDEPVFTAVVDGDPGEWPATGRLRAKDGVFDVPSARGHVDLEDAAVGEDAGGISVLLRTREPPRSDGSATYGFDIGSSGIDLGTFGKGATFLYRVEVAGQAVKVTKLDGNVPVTTGPTTSGAIGATAVELRLGKTDAPALDGLKDLAVRAFATEGGIGYSVQDRMQTFYLRSQFDMVTPAVSDPAWLDVHFLLPPGSADVALAAGYATLTGTLVKDLEAANGIPFYERGTLPLFFVGKEESGYAGLNTSDRGMLTTLGPGTGAIGRAQLLAHELAHFQNARSSRLKSRWLQEGMSEWSAERILYRHYPVRAVHRYLRRLRFDRYFDTLEGKLDVFPLDTWGNEVERSGYEKSLMFLDLVEQIVGQPALLAAFQVAVNEPTDGAAFKRALERETGKDLSGLFKYWVFAGDPLPEFDPYLVYKDRDGDELSALDEMTLGTDPTLVDTDGDGFTDAEELFGATDPVASALVATGTKMATVATDTSAFLRFGGDPHAKRTVSFDPYALTSPAAFSLPLFVRPPVSVAVSADGGAAEVFTRPLFVGGVEVATSMPSVGILPPVPGKQVVTDANIRLESSSVAVNDPDSDLPADASSYDLVSLSTTTKESGVISVVLNLKSNVSLTDGYGEYALLFQTVDWSLVTGPSIKKWHGLSALNGELYWSTVASDGQETTSLLTSGATVSASNKELRFDLTPGLTADWSTVVGERQVCAHSAVTFPGGTIVRDQAGCVSLGAPGFTQRRAVVPDAYGLGLHTLDAAFDTAHYDAARADELLKLAATAIREFELVLARPLLDRRQWPLHVALSDGGDTTAAAATSYGAHVSIDKAFNGATLDYLVVEQLARLVTADLLDRLGDRAYWLQEAFIQWLTATTLYRIYPARLVHDFHRARIEDFNCFLDGASGCATFFTKDVVLSGWAFSTLGSTGSVRSLLAALELDAIVGTPAMAKAFSLFFNAAPNGDALEAILIALSPGKSSDIRTFWTNWVNGSGDPTHDAAVARATTVDGDGDGLYAFEEARLGTSDAVANNYLAP